MRMIGAVRLSRDTDETTSPERQREVINAWGALHRHDVVHVTEDVDVSGAVSAFTRGDLGPWLTDAPPSPWDLLVVSKLDRLSRSILDFGRLLEWCQSRGKAIVSVSEGVDFSTPTGRLLASIIVLFAQFERDRMSERRSEAAVKLRKTARWGGGLFVYGYQPQATGAGWLLVPDPVTSVVVQRMADDMIGGMSANRLARQLTEEGVETPRKAASWSPETVLRVLRNPALRGYVVRLDGSIERGDDGLPVKRAPVLEDDTWTRLQAVLTSGKTPVHREGASPLLDVAHCGLCGRKLHSALSSYQGRKFAYYRCAGVKRGTCKAGLIPQRDLESRVDREVVERYASVKYPERIITLASDNSGELAEVEESIAEIEAEVMAKRMPASSAGRMLTALEERRMLLAAIKPRAERVEYVETSDETVADRYLRLDPEQRRVMLLGLGVRVDAIKVRKATKLKPAGIAVNLSSAALVTADS